ncbi:uncharacterized protein LOC113296522 [Papaver somniferum]|uniref:uncharacterized protein LOC113296522 n=1 Tax=Papaver somniferum TaxID=3469 RepID=UPI000E704BDC|nr:uncharacterized protein LOC113296522 [Papaver somniferum]
MDVDFLFFFFPSLVLLVMSGRRGTRNARNNQDNGNGEAPNFAEMMRLMTEEMTNQIAVLMAFMQNHNGNHNAPPPLPPYRNVDDHIQQGDEAQATWLNLLEKFVSLKPPSFKGSTDPLVVDKWKEDIEKIFVSMRSAFCERFDTRYFPAIMRHKKIKEFFDLEQVKRMLVYDYLDKYISLQRFAHFMVPDEDKSARKFENGLGDHIRSNVISHCFPTFQQVVDSARAIEDDWLRHRAIREISKEAKQKAFNNSKQGNNYQNQSNRNKGNGDFRSDRNNSGHKSFECTNLRRQRPKTLGDNQGQAKDARSQQQNSQNQSNGQNRTNSNQGRFHALVPRQEQVPDGVVEGMFIIQDKLGRILFDSGATHSFISTAFGLDLSIKVIPCETPLSVMSPLGKTTLIDRIVRGCNVQLGSLDFPTDLYVLDMVGFDVILGIYWLSSYHAMLDCQGKSLVFSIPENQGFFVVTTAKEAPPKAYFCGVLDEYSSLENVPLNSIPVVAEFGDVFAEISGLPPHREVEFCI